MHYSMLWQDVFPLHCFPLLKHLEYSIGAKQEQLAGVN